MNARDNRSSPPTRPASSPRRICFVTGTRAEYGLMRSTLKAISGHPRLQLQLIATGMHLDRSHGRSIDDIRADGWPIDATVSWSKSLGSQTSSAVATGKAIASLATCFENLQTDIVLVTGDRVEAFAAASAGHISGRLVAHVHGGDRALGQVDDSLRHAITKLCHVHFPATKQSAGRIEKMGEDPWRIFRVGSPALDDIRASAAKPGTLAEMFPALRRHPYALLVLHPTTTDGKQERASAEMLLKCVESVGLERVVIIHPNNDPGSDAIASAWNAVSSGDQYIIRRNVARPVYLGLLRDAAVLIGNSSSGIIEAASFGTAVLNIGDRQRGRERGENVTHVSFDERAIRRALSQLWNNGEPVRSASNNLYGTGRAGKRIAAALARINPKRFRTKLIAY